MFRLDDKIALVTGAGSGIGKAIATTYAAQGAKVWVADIGDEAAESTVSEIADAGGTADSILLDVRDKARVEAAVSTVAAADGRLDILVNNAGVSAIGTVLETTEEDWDRVMAVNVKGVYLCSQAAVAQMLTQSPKGGVIVNMASIASTIGIVDRFAYSASKGAVLQMTRCLALDHVRDNIRCNCICPARVHTPFVDDYLDKHYPNNRDEMFQKLSEYQPIGRMGQPEEVAAMAVYLASDEAAFVTGSAHHVDGGVTAG